METGFSGGIYNICVWMTRFAYINILWLMFCLLGLIIFGFFPATAATFAISRRWIKGQNDIPLFCTFWKEYKLAFFKTNIIGALLSIFGSLLYFNFQFLAMFGEGIFVDLLFLLLLALTFLYAVVSLYVFPVYSHYQVNTLDTFKNAFFVGISSPLMTVLIIISAGCFYVISLAFPGTILLFAASALCFTTMWFAHCAFKKIEESLPNLNE